MRNSSPLIVSAGHLHRAIGLRLVLHENAFDYLRSCDADEKIEIEVSYEGENRQFSCKEFVRLLGFTDEETCGIIENVEGLEVKVEAYAP